MHRFSSKLERFPFARKSILWGGLLILFYMLAPPLLVHASGFTIRSAATLLEDQVYLLDARVDYQLSEEAVRALQSGIPLIILADIEVTEERNWWWDKTIAELNQGYLLIYHALTEKYIVSNLNSGAQDDFNSLTAAMQALGNIERLPLLDAGLVKGDKEYEIRMRVYLDIESLPAPMRPLAYVSSDWQLESEWFTWSLQP